MWDHTIDYKFSPSIEVEDIPKVEAFITYLQTLITISKEKQAKDDIEKEIRSTLRKKSKKNIVKE